MILLLTNLNASPESTYTQMAEESNSTMASSMRAGPSTSPLPASFQPGPFDVICARGKDAFTHSKNIRYRSMIEASVNRYSEARTKLDRSIIVSEIVNFVRKSHPPGGFVRWKEGRWYEIGDSQAREKIGQALRDFLHTKYKSSNKAKRERRHTIEDFMKRSFDRENDALSQLPRDIDFFQAETSLRDVVGSLVAHPELPRTLDLSVKVDPLKRFGEGSASNQNDFAPTAVQPEPVDWFAALNAVDSAPTGPLAFQAGPMHPNLLTGPNVTMAQSQENGLALRRVDSIYDEGVASSVPLTANPGLSRSLDSLIVGPCDPLVPVEELAASNRSDYAPSPTQVHQKQSVDGPAISTLMDSARTGRLVYQAEPMHHNLLVAPSVAAVQFQDDGSAQPLFEPFSIFDEAPGNPNPTLPQGGFSPTIFDYTSFPLRSSDDQEDESLP